MNIREVVLKCLAECNLLIDDSIATDVDVNEYGIDSLTFVSFIVSLEEELGVEIPDVYLTTDVLRSLNGFVSLVQQFIIDSSSTDFPQSVESSIVG